MPENPDDLDTQPAEGQAVDGPEASASSVPPAAPCPPCKGGAPPWMATFADMATLLMAFFVLILSFAETNVPKYKQISGSLKAAFGVKRIVPTITIPSARSLVVEDFSPAEAQRTINDSKAQRSEDTTRENIIKKTGDGKADFEVQQDFRSMQQLLSEEILLGQVELRIENQRIVVEMQSTVTAGGNHSSAIDSLSGGPVSQETIDVAAKVVDAQSQLVTEVEVRSESVSSAREDNGSGKITAAGVTQGEAEGQTDNTDQRYQQLRTDLAAEVQMGLVELERKDNRITLRLASQGSFVSGSADLQQGFETLLSRVGNSLAKSQGPVRVEGHTDNVPVAFSQRFNSNWDLSAARSAAVADFFVKRANLTQENITVAGFADTRPIDTNNTAEGRARNRRIEVIIDEQ
ncbi:MAG: flagellar motor protein MotB [Porticoccaceae bacterium]